MRTIAAILFSALLVITQGVAALLPGHWLAPATCCGCDCTRRSCCNTVPRPTNQPAPAQPLAAQRGGAALREVARAPVAIPLEPALRSASDCSASTPSPARSHLLPLFRQHCALLL